MAKNVIIYNAGYMNTSFYDGLVGYNAFTFSTDHIELRYASFYDSAVHSKNKIPIDEYDSIVVTYEDLRGNDEIIVGLGKNSANTYTTNLVKYEYGYSGSTTVEVDISDITGEYYLYIIFNDDGASGTTYDKRVLITKIELKTKYSDVVFVEDNTDNIPYIYTNSGWCHYEPYITANITYSWDGLFTATVTGTNDSLYLRSSTSTTYSNLVLVPYGTVLTAKDIVIGADGTTILIKATYSSKTGYADIKYLDFVIHGEINNTSGASINSQANDSSSYRLTTLPYGTKITTVANSSGSHIVIGNSALWCYTSILYNNIIYTGYIKLSNIKILSQYTSIGWVKMTP